MEVLQEQLIAVVGTVLTVIAGYAVSKLKAYLDRKGIVDKFKIYESSAKIAVGAVEQIYYNEDGPAKFDKAKKYMAKELQKQGIPLDDDDLQYWIESAVAGMNQGWKQTEITLED